MKPLYYKILIITVFVSGFTALVYQMVWFRELQQVFGIHVFSVSAVLSAFMAGLALGSHIFGKLSDKVTSPLQLFIRLELLIGLFAFSFPFVFPLVLQSYYFLTDGFELSVLQLNTVKFLYSFLFLFIPSTLMGGVIPVVSKLIVQNTSILGKKISILYAFNNLGAALGCLMAGFIMIRFLGNNASLFIAASLNILNALVLFILSGKKWQLNDLGVDVQSTEKEVFIRVMRPGNVRIVLWVFAIEGFTTLAYQLLWTRLLIEFAYDKTAYLNPVIVSAFILGLSIGGYLAKNRVDSMKDPTGALGWLQVLIGVVSVISLLAFVAISPSLVQQRALQGTWLSIAGKEYLIIFFFIVFPVILMGFTFPLVSKIYASNKALIGKSMGRVGFLDTIGSVFGSFVTAFFMIPLLGIYNSFIGVVFLNIFMGFLLWFVSSSDLIKKRMRLITMVVIVLAFIFFIPSQSHYFQQRINYYPTDRILSYAEGVAATVSVHGLPSGHKALAINGSKTAFTTADDLKVHGLLSVMPYIFNAQAQNALVIGFGMGVTTRHLAEFDIPDVHVVELAPQVVRTSLNQFASLNERVDQMPNVTIKRDDGRSFLISSKQKWDIITSNAIHARLGANLYTRDFYEICKENSTPSGVVCQWLPTNWLTDKEFKAMVRSFVDVYPNSALWYVTRGHFLLTGTSDEHTIDYSRISQLFETPETLSVLLDIDIRTPAELLSFAFADANSLQSYISDAPLNTDNHPVIEFSIETEFKPNIRVLEQLVELEFDFGDNMVFRNDTLAEQKIPNIKMFNQYKRKELQMFINNFK